MAARSKLHLSTLYTLYPVQRSLQYVQGIRVCADQLDTGDCPFCVQRPLFRGRLGWGLHAGVGIA